MYRDYWKRQTFIKAFTFSVGIFNTERRLSGNGIPLINESLI